MPINFYFQVFILYFQNKLKLSKVLVYVKFSVDFSTVSQFVDFNRFIENKDHVATLRKCFAGLWSLDNEEIVRTAMDKPELFVLKPQREGGGAICPKTLTPTKYVTITVRMDSIPIVW
jgi:Eukaryotic glutathione synthase, ATP binding domain